MEYSMQYQDKGYMIIVMQTRTGYVSQIQHPCGEVVELCAHLLSKRNAVYWAICNLEGLNHAHHECTNEACENNRYLAQIRGLKKL